MKNFICIMLGWIPILVNIVVSRLYAGYAQMCLFDKMGMDARLDENGNVQYHFGVGSASLVFMLLLLLVSIIWIIVNGKVFCDKKKQKIYILVRVVIVVVIDVAWILYFLISYPLTGHMICIMQQPY
ncbi:MAG: hypothetical protein E7292_01990 [Lachnospiraceae bacterium]|nr:hypothetical protein [Lachnospiraceae bacterium]